MDLQLSRQSKRLLTVLSKVRVLLSPPCFCWDVAKPVRHRTLTPACSGSNPDVPAIFFLVELYPSVVKESVCNTVIAGSNPANSSKILLLWWNRQTRRFKEPMLSGVRVRVSLGAPITDIVQWQNNGLQNHQHRFDSCYLCHNSGQICKLVKQADCKSVTSDTLQVQILLCPPFFIRVIWSHSSVGRAKD